MRTEAKFLSLLRAVLLVTSSVRLLVAIIVMSPKSKSIALRKELAAHRATFCMSVLEKLKLKPDAAHFLQPVAILWPTVQNYTQVIKKPMDLGTVTDKMEDGRYNDRRSRMFNHRKFVADVMLVFKNCCKYNIENSHLYQVAEKLANEFTKEMERLPSQVSKAQEKKDEDINKNETSGEADNTMKSDPAEGSSSKIICEHKKTSKSDDVDPLIKEESSDNDRPDLEDQNTWELKDEYNEEKQDLFVDDETSNEDLEVSKANDLEQKELLKKSQEQGEKIEKEMKTQNFEQDKVQAKQLSSSDVTKKRKHRKLKQTDNYKNTETEGESSNSSSKDDSKSAKKHKRRNVNRTDSCNESNSDGEARKSSSKDKEEVKKMDEVDRKVTILSRELDRTRKLARAVRQDEMTREEIVKLRDAVEQLPWDLTKEVVRVMRNSGYVEKEVPGEAIPEFVSIDLDTVDEKCLREIEDIARPSTTHVFLLEKIAKLKQEIRVLKSENHENHEGITA